MLRALAGHTRTMSHKALYGCLICTDAILCGAALAAGEWLTAACSLAAGAVYAAFAAHHSSRDARSPRETVPAVRDLGMGRVVQGPLESPTTTRGVGLIDILLPEGISVRVDAGVDGRALYEVLSTLRKNR